MPRPANGIFWKKSFSQPAFWCGSSAIFWNFHACRAIARPEHRPQAGGSHALRDQLRKRARQGHLLQLHGPVRSGQGAGHGGKTGSSRRRPEQSAALADASPSIRNKRILLAEENPSARWRRGNCRPPWARGWTTADDGLEAGMAAHLLSEALTRLPGRACCALRAAAACGIAEA